MDTSSLVLGLKSEWAILIALFILTSVQIIKIIFDNVKARKERSEYHKRIGTLVKIESYLKILSEKYTEEITERQLPVVIREFLDNCKNSIVAMGYSSIMQNNIEFHEKEIRAKLTQFVHNRFKGVYMDLSLFKWKGNLLSDFVIDNWGSIISKEIVEIVIKSSKCGKDEAFNQLNTFTDQKFDALFTKTLSKAYEA